MQLDEALKSTSEAVDEAIDLLLPQEVKGRLGENRLARAMRYSSQSGGKRIRPFLVLNSASLFGVSQESAMQAAVAVECVHTFSLIHDDLPAMDDDDERRGKPSSHKEFDEATAILAGDALLAFAFELLSDPDTHYDPMVRCELVKALSQSTGIKGMVGGQMIDMLSEDRELNIDQITRLQRMKTGALFAVSCEAGAILGKASHSLRNSLRAYANDLGLVFQITDDLLDAEADEQSGRTDKSSHKGTYISVLGVDKARRHAEILAHQATEHLNGFGKRAALLHELVDFVIHRTH